MPDTNKTLADHLRDARAKRSKETLRATMAIARAAKPLAKCTCHRTDGTHYYKCPVYLRAAQQRSRANRAQKGQIEK